MYGSCRARIFGHLFRISPHLSLRKYVATLKCVHMRSKCSYMYGLLTKYEVKMAGYWPSSFFACLWTETESKSINTQKENEANIKPS